MDSPTLSRIAGWLLPTCLAFAACDAAGQAAFKFERMWPTLAQPWYFADPLGIATDADGLVYLADSGNGRLVILNPAGQILSQTRGTGVGAEPLGGPRGVALDPDGFVYLTDSDHRVKKLDRAGQFVAAWGGQGSDPGKFDFPTGVAVDPVGFLYVVDANNDRVQKFSLDGQYVAAIGGFDFSDEFGFAARSGVAVGPGGSLYVVESGAHRVQRFDSDGVLETQWGSFGSGQGQFRWPTGVAVDRDGFVYVVDDMNSRVQKFDSSGQFIGSWGGCCSGDGALARPAYIAIDTTGNVYVTASFGLAVQKFTTSGHFLSAWSHESDRAGRFSNIVDVAVDADDFVYVADRISGLNGRIQKFNGTGSFVAGWQGQLAQGVSLGTVSAVQVDGAGFIYIGDLNSHRVLKLAADGTFVTQWGGPGNGDGQFHSGGAGTNSGPGRIAIDAGGFVYVTDGSNLRVQKFTAAGEFVLKWGGFASPPYAIAAGPSDAIYVGDDNVVKKFDDTGALLTQWQAANRVEGLAVDDAGAVYALSGETIQKFDPDGTLLATFGRRGTDPGALHTPLALAIASGGRLVVADSNNARIQVFQPAALAEHTKAIVVAGGGPFAGNVLWNATQSMATLAYRTLQFQGFDKDDIRFLADNTALDLDGNGLIDDVDGPATAAALQTAITTWAADAEALVLYLTDHGGDRQFRLSGAETVSDAQLDAWLDELQAGALGRVTVIYDACESGSFVPGFMPPAGEDRVTITSASAGEPAYFTGQGLLSFSSFFWTEILNGASIGAAYATARTAVETASTPQFPLLDGTPPATGSRTSRPI